MADKHKPGPVRLADPFTRLSAAEKAPSIDMGIHLLHLMHAQKYTRALILEGLDGYEQFMRDKQLNVVLLANGDEAIGGEAARVYGKSAGNLTPEELVLANYGGSLSEFLKGTGYTKDTAVSYVVLNPNRHAILAIDEEGGLTVVRRNEGFNPRLH